MKVVILAAFALAVVLGATSTGSGAADDRVRIANGVVEGVTDENGVRAFKGVPFAQPPVGDLRWKPPQPARDWDGVRKADKFGPRAMQLPLFGDMVFRSDGMSEDCLYLNVWTTAKSGDERLPVLVYFYGGGFVAGDGSEPRYDGASMAAKGIVAVTVNYRLGVFGFLAHPELTKESPHHASGDYGLMDQAEALRWVRRNIAAFGGDPGKVTIAGESAGSLSVCAQMASPLSKDLFAGAIGESGSLMGTLTPVPLAEAEQAGVRFAADVGAKSLADLRKLPAEDLLKAKSGAGVARFPVAIDGYFLTEDPAEVFAAGKQVRIPLLVGWNSQEAGWQGVLGREKPTRDDYAAAVKRLYGDRADEALKLYPAADDGAVEQAASRPGGRPLHRLQHLEVGRPARPDRGQAGLPIPVRPPAAADAAGPGCGAFGRDRVRAGQPRHEQGLRLDGGRLQGLEGDAGVLRQLREDGRPQRRRTCRSGPRPTAATACSSCGWTWTRAPSRSGIGTATCSRTTYSRRSRRSDALHLGAGEVHRHAPAEDGEDDADVPVGRCGGPRLPELGVRQFHFQGVRQRERLLRRDDDAFHADERAVHHPHAVAGLRLVYRGFLGVHGPPPCPGDGRMHGEHPHSGRRWAQSGRSRQRLLERALLRRLLATAVAGQQLLRCAAPTCGGPPAACP